MHKIKTALNELFCAMLERLQYLFDESGLDGFYGDPNAFNLATGQFNFNFLQIGLENTGNLLGDVSSNTPAFLGLTFTTNTRPNYPLFLCNVTNAYHRNTIFL